MGINGLSKETDGNCTDGNGISFHPAETYIELFRKKRTWDILTRDDLLRVMFFS